jgi:hypothetical protein
MVTRRQLDELRRLLGDTEECPECGEALRGEHLRERDDVRFRPLLCYPLPVAPLS